MGRSAGRLATTAADSVAFGAGRNTRSTDSRERGCPLSVSAPFELLPVSREAVAAELARTCCAISARNDWHACSVMRPTLSCLASSLSFRRSCTPRSSATNTSRQSRACAPASASPSQTRTDCVCLYKASANAACARPAVKRPTRSPNRSWAKRPNRACVHAEAPRSPQTRFWTRPGEFEVNRLPRAPK